MVKLNVMRLRNQYIRVILVASDCELWRNKTIERPFQSLLHQTDFTTTYDRASTLSPPLWKQQLVSNGSGEPELIQEQLSRSQRRFLGNVIHPCAWERLSSFTNWSHRQGRQQRCVLSALLHVVPLQSRGAHHYTTTFLMSLSISSQNPKFS